MANPSLALVPSGYKATKLYSILPTDGTGDFTVARASTATRVNSDGLLETVADNVPRIDYTDGGCPVLLTEPQATNLITYPISFDNAYWTKSGSTVVSGQSAPSVDFPTSAFALVETTLSTFHATYVTSAITISASTNYTMSALVKKGGRKHVAVGIAQGGANGVMAQYDLDLETLVFGQAIGVYTYVGSDIKKYADDYYLISCTFSSTSTSVKPTVAMSDDIYTNADITDVADNYVGDITKKTYIFMAQLEQGSVATSPTFTDTTLAAEGSITTRIADVITGGGDVNTFNDSEGVLYLNISSLVSTGTNQSISISNNTISNRILFRYNGLNEIRVIVVSANVFSFDATISLSDIKDYNKIAIKYKVNDFALWVNGVEIASDLIGSTPIGLIDLSFDDGSAVNNFLGNTKEIQVFKTALTDAELTALTT